MWIIARGSKSSGVLYSTFIQPSLMKMSVVLMCLFALSIVHARGSEEAVIENPDKLSWKESLDQCSRANGKLFSNFSLDLASAWFNTSNRSNNDQYWVNGFIKYSFLRYVGCINASLINVDEDSGNDIDSLTGCIEHCDQPQYHFIAISDSRCVCISNNTKINTTKIENCTLPCDWNPGVLCGTNKTYVVFSKHPEINVTGDPLQSCIYQIHGAYHSDRCNSTYQGYNCSNGSVYAGNVTWIEAQQRCVGGRGSGVPHNLKNKTRHWTPYYRQHTVLRNSAYRSAMFSGHRRCLSLSKNYTSPVFRNCSDRLKSFCDDITLPSLLVSHDNLSWEEAVAFTRTNKSMLANTDSFVNRIAMRRAIPKGISVWTGGYLSNRSTHSSVFGIYGCIDKHSVNISFNITRNYVSLSECSERCKGSKYVALMKEACACMEEWNRTKCSPKPHLCSANSIDRCGNNDSYSVYKRHNLEDLDTTETGNCVYGIKEKDGNSTFGLASCDEQYGFICKGDVPFKNYSWREGVIDCYKLLGGVKDVSDLSVIINVEPQTRYWIGRYIPDVFLFVSVSDQWTTISPRECLAVKMENGALKEQLLDCSAELRFVYQTESITMPADETTTVMTVDASTTSADSATTTSTAENKTVNHMEGVSTIAPPLSIPYAMYGLIGGIIVVVLILSIVCGVLCILMMRYKELKGQLSSKSLKGPTISYSNLEYSDFNCSGKATHGDSVDSDPLKGDESNDRVAGVMIQDDNSDVKPADLSAYSECCIVTDNSTAKQNNKECLNKGMSNLQIGSTGNECIYSMAKSEKEEDIYQNEDEMGISNPITNNDQDDIYVNSINDSPVDDKRIYQNNNKGFASKEGDESDYDYDKLFKVRDDEKTNALYDTSANIAQENRRSESASDKHNSANNVTVVINPEDSVIKKGSEYDRVNIVNDTYDELETQLNRSRSKPAVLHYEDIELPPPPP